jgi:hypothetical protein
MFASYSGFSDVDEAIPASVKKVEKLFFDEDLFSPKKFIELGQNHLSFDEPSKINQCLTYRKKNTNNNVHFYDTQKSFINSANRKRGRKSALKNPEEFIYKDEVPASEAPDDRIFAVKASEDEAAAIEASEDKAAAAETHTSILGKRPSKSPVVYEPTPFHASPKKKRRIVAPKEEEDEAVAEEKQKEKENENKKQESAKNYFNVSYDMDGLQTYCKEVKRRSTLLKNVEQQQSNLPFGLHYETIFDDILQNVHPGSPAFQASTTNRCTKCNESNSNNNIVRQCNKCGKDFCHMHMFHNVFNGHDVYKKHWLVSRYIIFIIM